MTNGELSNLIPEFLYDKRAYSSQFFNSTGIPEEFRQFVNKKGLTIDDSDSSRFREAFWRLVSRDLVAPGNEKGGVARLPFVSITEYGIKCFEEGKILPYDPDHFINSLVAAIPGIDDIIMLYFEESVNCFTNMSYLASAVLTGCSIERMVIFLTEEFFKKIDPSLQTNYQKNVLHYEKVGKRTEKFIHFIDTNQLDNSFPISDQEKLRALLPSIVNLIRITRNEAGHPTGRVLERDEAQANLLLAKEGIKFSYHFLSKF